MEQRTEAFATDKVTMPHAYTEDQLIEQPAIELFAGLGGQTIGAFDEVLGVRRDDFARVHFGLGVLLLFLQFGLQIFQLALPFTISN